MNYEKLIDERLAELRKRKEILEKDYDENVLPMFIKENRNAKNHESYTRVLNVTYDAIQKIDIQIELLQEIKEKAR